MESPDPKDRIHAAAGIARSADPQFAPFLRNRLQSETDGAVRARLEAALQAPPK